VKSAIQVGWDRGNVVIVETEGGVHSWTHTFTPSKALKLAKALIKSAAMAERCMPKG